MPIFALKRLVGTQKLRHVFSSDIQPYCRRFLEIIHKPDMCYADIAARDVQATQDCHVYIWGPPCQSFSIGGKRRGAKDERGVLSKFSLAYIAYHKPRLTIMEPATCALETNS